VIARGRAPLLALALLCSTGAGAAPGFVYGPYKDVTLGLDERSLLMAPPPAPQAVVSWAFASGECGDEHWAGRDAARFAAVNVAAHVRAGARYIVSTGGAKGVFTCGSEAGMARFVARYDSPQLVGFDFDIEAGQTPALVDALVQRVAFAQRNRPGLRFSFTLATHAGSDARRAGLNAQGRAVVQALQRHGLRDAVINLMVMDYGPADAGVCVLGADGRCDMGRSGLQAARNLQRRHGVPLRRIALTPMLGINDVVENVVDLDAARRVARDARQHGLAGLHYWSLDRDRPCDGGATAVSPLCSSLNTLPAGAFDRAMQDALR
jgi:hypothetical protein